METTGRAELVFDGRLDAGGDALFLIHEHGRCAWANPAGRRVGFGSSPRAGAPPPSRRRDGRRLVLREGADPARVFTALHRLGRRGAHVRRSQSRRERRATTPAHQFVGADLRHRERRHVREQPRHGDAERSASAASATRAGMCFWSRRSTRASRFSSASCRCPMAGTARSARRHARHREHHGRRGGRRRLRCARGFVRGRGRARRKS